MLSSTFIGVNMPLLYEAFIDIQQEHQRAIIYGEDFSRRYNSEEKESIKVQECEVK